MAPAASQQDTYLVVISDNARVYRQRCRPTAAFRTGSTAAAGPATASAPLASGSFLAMYTRDTASSWGAKVYCHVALGGAMADQTSVAALMVPVSLISPVYSNTTFFGPPAPEGIAEPLNHKAFFFWQLTNNDACCAAAAAGQLGTECPVLGLVTPVELADLGGEAGEVTLYTPCDTTWGLQRSFACRVAQPAAVALAAAPPAAAPPPPPQVGGGNGSSTGGGSSGSGVYELVLFTAAVPFWTASQRCVVLGGRLLSLPGDARVWGEEAATAWPEGAVTTVWVLDSGANCSLGALPAGAQGQAQGGNVTFVKQDVCDMEYPFVCAAALLRIAEDFDAGPGSPCDLSSWSADPTASDPCAWQPRVGCAPAVPTSPGQLTVTFLNLTSCWGSLTPAEPDAPAYVGGMTFPGDVLRLLGLRTLLLTDTGVTSGAIPGVLSILTNLQWLDLAYDRAAVSATATVATGGSAGVVTAAGGLAGSLPAAWSVLTGLTRLSLGGASLSGSLPTNYSALTGLRLLDLRAPGAMSGAAIPVGGGGGGLVGGLPPAWSAMRSLQALSAPGHGALGGSLPAEYGAMSELFALDLRSCGLTGTLPLSFTDMSSLVALALSDNSLSGSLPPSYSALRRLQVLDVSTNVLSGALPGAWSALSALSALNASDNALTGGLPPAWSRLTSLAALDISGNGALAGSLPAAWSAMRSLAALAAGRNALDGNLPAAWAPGLSSLRSLRLASNALSGSLPPSYSLLTRLTEVDLSDNQLVGAVPPGWLGAEGGLPSLQALTLGANELTGALPDVAGAEPAAGGLSLQQQLRRLDLSANALGPGPLPDASQPYLSALASLDLSATGMTGTLPAAWSGLTALTALLLGSNGLTGTLPPEWAALRGGSGAGGGGGSSARDSDGGDGGDSGGGLVARRRLHRKTPPPFGASGNSPPTNLQGSTPPPPAGVEQGRGMKQWWVGVIVASAVGALLLLLAIAAVFRWRGGRNSNTVVNQPGTGELDFSPLGPAAPAVASSAGRPPALQLPFSPAGATPSAAAAPRSASKYAVSPGSKPPSPGAAAASGAGQGAGADAGAGAPPPGLDRPSMYAQFHNPIFLGGEDGEGVADWRDVMSAFLHVEQEGDDPDPAARLKRPSSPGRNPLLTFTPQAAPQTTPAPQPTPSPGRPSTRPASGRNVGSRRPASEV
ncbi:hypothetical protein GPECTOR_106g136 [Gonium pectorale]|uniref:Uncharacterized protein n=1 Tax=Gonium pectorale TaxID=33097 RepID=A0A150FZM2_GONPE|nr:hypothetical protein GPECTOR_106g136 [Gonium pectorale]|eukprot:KXZ43042.1 hypothetical protein GPECTOR_106g136 [Gonium pectorale]